MRKILILLLALMPVIINAQSLTKEERKAIKEAAKAERREQKRIQDSIYMAEIAEQQRIYDEQRRRSKSTALLVVTPFESPKDVFNALVNKILQEDTVPALIDKDFFIIRTQRKQVAVGTYDITYSVFKKDGKVCVRGTGTGYGSFSVENGMFRGNTEMIVPLEYGSVEGSTAKTAWNEIEHYLLQLKSIEVIYEYQ